MPGLLDFLNSDDPAKQQGLMAAAAAMLQASGPSRTPTSLGQILGGGLGAYQGGMQAQQDRVQQQALYDLKLRGMTGELDEQERARKQALDFDQAARDAYQTPAQQALAGGGGPTQDNAAKIPQMQGGFDVNAFLGKGMSIDPLKALQLAQSMKKAGPKYDSGITFVNGPDGKPMALRTADDGSFKQLYGVAPRDKMELASLGNRDVAYNPYGLTDGQTFARGVDPSTAANNALGYARLNWDKSESAAADQPAKPNETIAKQIAFYKAAPLGQFSLNKPWGQATMDRVIELNPQYDAAQYAPRAAALRAYSPGGKEALGIDSINIGMNHVATLRELALANKSGNTQAFNRIANEWAAATGQAPPTNLRMAADMVAPEVVKAVSGVAGTGEERAHFAHSLTGNGSYSPDQIIGATGEVQKLFAGRLSEKKRSYERGTQLDNFDAMLSPAAAALLQQKSGPTGQSAAPKQSALPGQVSKGYRFKGGDPSVQSNWEKI